MTGSIINVGFTGNVTSSSTDSSSNYIGGLIGWLSGGSVTDSYTIGSVSSVYTESNSSGTGGLVGVARSGASISGSYATGTVSAKYVAGGLVGRTVQSSPNVQITESYATGNVSSSVQTAGVQTTGWDWPRRPARTRSPRQPDGHGGLDIAGSGHLTAMNLNPGQATPHPQGQVIEFLIRIPVAYFALITSGPDGNP